MYSVIYFDLDDTLIHDNPVTGRSEVLSSGYDLYMGLRSEYPNVPMVLFTNRLESEIRFPDVYSFDMIVGRDGMREYIVKNMGSFGMKDVFSLRRLYIFLRGYFLYRRGETCKLLYVFLKHVRHGESVMIIDDDMRVAGMFRR